MIPGRVDSRNSHPLCYVFLRPYTMLL